MRSYQAARGAFSFLSFIAWCVIISGGLLAFGGSIALQSAIRHPGVIHAILGTVPGVLFSMSGLFGLIMVQMGRTGVDGAEYAQQSLDVARQQLDISKQLLSQGKTPIAPTFADVHQPSTAPQASTSGDTDTTGPTYANQPEATPRPNETPTPQTLNPTEETPTLGANAKAALPPPSADIVYRDGEFVVGNRGFKTKDAAVDHQKELLAIPRGELR